MPLKFSTAMVEVGIVTTQLDTMLHFYRDVLGLPYKEDLRFPGGYQHRLQCGDSIIKLVSLDPAPSGRAPEGAFGVATGVRYLSFPVTNLREVVEEVRQAGHDVPNGVMEFAPSFGFTMFQDPDGNWIELFGPI